MSNSETSSTSGQDGQVASRAASLGVDTKLLELLVCPVTKGPLDYDAVRQELVSKSAKLAYPVRDGIPIMLADEARRI